MNKIQTSKLVRLAERGEKRELKFPGLQKIVDRKFSLMFCTYIFVKIAFIFFFFFHFGFSRRKMQHRNDGGKQLRRLIDWSDSLRLVDQCGREVLFSSGTCLFQFQDVSASYNRLFQYAR